ncbi:hypothetical protein Pla100_30100 [Neorhodopirellula pilleata]|uniref:Uncharacterized protein n=1 Tax=Neorhodopirellula pilleata TaxID=2714738 RepID=A0A5C6AAY2_9BACT|nr:hypothetical protein Pla100_30100 [Neorhodopirellula pilleata]
MRSRFGLADSDSTRIRSKMEFHLNIRCKAIDVTSWYERHLARRIPGSDSDRLGEFRKTGSQSEPKIPRSQDVWWPRDLSFSTRERAIRFEPQLNSESGRASEPNRGHHHVEERFGLTRLSALLRHRSEIAQQCRLAYSVIFPLWEKYKLSSIEQYPDCCLDSIVGRGLKFGTQELQFLGSRWARQHLLIE